MSQGGLGNIFDAANEDAAAKTGPPGPDFRVAVEIPRSALGATVRVPTPARMEIDGRTVARALGPGDESDAVQIHISEGFADGATLRLRGQGGVSSDKGRAGDLYLTVRFVDTSTGARVWLWAVAAVVAGASAAIWYSGWLR